MLHAVHRATPSWNATNVSDSWSGCQKFFFVHVPKTGGTSVSELIRETGKPFGAPLDSLRFPIWYKKVPEHDTAQSQREHAGAAEWSRAFTFSIVRDPYDWAVSQFFFHVDAHCGRNPMRNYTTHRFWFCHVARDTRHALNSTVGRRHAVNHTDPRLVGAFARWLREMDAGNFSDVGLIADFGLLYWRAMREQGLGGVLSQQGVPLSFVDSV